MILYMVSVKATSFITLFLKIAAKVSPTLVVEPTEKFHSSEAWRLILIHGCWFSALRLTIANAFTFLLFVFLFSRTSLATWGAVACFSTCFAFMNLEQFFTMRVYVVYSIQYSVAVYRSYRRGYLSV